MRGYLRRVIKAFSFNRAVTHKVVGSVKRDITAIAQGDKVVIWVQMNQYGALMIEATPEGAWLIGQQIIEAADAARAARAE